MIGRLLKSVALIALLALAPLEISAAAASPGSETRSVEIETREVTRPDVAVSRDGEWLIFTALGHLLRVPVAGGTAEQLTFGPYFDSDPAISPDGRQVVFASDRDGRSDGNLFLLDLASGDVRQLTRESWAARPVWSPDGQSIGYLSYERAGMWAEYEYVAEDGVKTHVRRLSVKGGAPETVTDAPGLIRSVFFLPDGRMAWTALGGIEGEMRGHDLGGHGDMGPAQSRIEVSTSKGDVSTLFTVGGVVDEWCLMRTGRASTFGGTRSPRPGSWCHSRKR